MNTALSIIGMNSVTIEVTPDAVAVRDSLLSRARKGSKISSAASAARASELLHELKGFTRTIESQRKEAKAPVLDLGRRIEAVARELTDEVEAEARRISLLIGEYNAGQARIAEEARLAAEEAKRAANPVEVIVAAPVKQADIRTRTDIEFTITNIAALFAARPSLVRLEPENAVIKAHCSSLPDGYEIPGLAWKRVAKAIAY